jgi:hypothetical protein
MPMTLEEAVVAHQTKFGDAPTTMGFPLILEPAIVALLEKAVADGKPLDDDALTRKLGLELPPKDALL